MGLQVAENIKVFDVVIIESFNDNDKPCFSKYRVSRNTLTRVLLDYQEAGYTIVGIYPLEETVDSVEDIVKETVDEVVNEVIDEFDGL